MKIMVVEYKQLHSFGSYNNESVGASAYVEEGENATDALDMLKGWVAERLRDNEQIRRERDEMEVDWREGVGTLEELNRKVEAAKAQWGKVTEFLAKHGVSPEVDDDLPF